MQKIPTRRCSRLRLAWLGGIVVVACVALLAWYFPARWAMVWIEPSLHGVRLQQVHGSLWRGRADRVLLPDGSVLGRLAWEVSRRVVYAPVPVRLHLYGPQLAFSGDVRLLPHGQTRWEHVKLRGDFGLWPLGNALGVGRPSGTLQVTVNQALLQDGWPLQLDLQARWHDAAVRTSRGRVALGELEWRVSASAGVIDARVHDVDGGPLHVTGQLLLSPLGWRLHAELRPRQANPGLQRWLAELGTTDAAGVVHVRRRGGMALMPASSARSATDDSDGQGSQ